MRTLEGVIFLLNIICTILLTRVPKYNVTLEEWNHDRDRIHKLF